MNIINPGCQPWLMVLSCQSLRLHQALHPVTLAKEPCLTWLATTCPLFALGVGYIKILIKFIKCGNNFDKMSDVLG